MARRPVVGLIYAPRNAGRELRDHLERRGFEVREAAEEWAAGSLISAPGLDVVVVAEGMPAAAARDLLKRFGGEGGPAFIVICRPGDLVERVLALELGAADVVESPVNARELAARIGGLLARRGKAAPELAIFENATVDLKAALVMHRSGEEEQLSPGQIGLLRLFLASPRKVLTRDDIIAAAPAESADAFDRSIDSRIVRLRRKLDTESIVTIRGAGYRFDPPADFRE
ncbi:winged helix-turn-helix domain-containing protein [Allomesorhizobium camelthorni]|uniref:Response regulator transcription factor n=1 Tax=Allomesorhizobium camelthorni TaxID=475069 RepID=A0A6G4WAM4_9HYPH|nr:response regulator transcription factor [Mesorhizobium camelthorni]NGO51835.1 response regulator transcription factor [Mesorhizobium camelthorni]